MALLLNKFTKELFECEEAEVEVLTSPEKFREFVDRCLGRITGFEVDLAKFEYSYKYKQYCYVTKNNYIPCTYCFNRELKMVPNTKASRILYGAKK